jgi:hypothetical protein
MPAFLLRHRRICQLNDGMSAGQLPVLTAEFRFPQLSFRPKFVSFELLAVLGNIQLATDKIRTGAKGRAAVIWKGQTAMTETLTHADIRDLLKGFSAGIELDQLRVDAMPAANFKAPYNDRMWRGWRSGHISYINKLLSSVDRIPPAMLKELTWIAMTYEPKVIGQVALELFADAVSGSCPEEELGTAERFFGWLIKQAGDDSQHSPRSQGARSSVLQWLAVTDPLRIARDPECGYGQPAGFVS